MEALCARAEHCEWELRRKLQLWKIDPEDAEKIISSLRSRRFVDDARFARACVRDKFMFSCWGRRKITAALRAKHIPQTLIAEALTVIDETEYVKMAEKLLNQKLAHAGEDTYESRSKAFRAVCARGFEPDIVARLLHAPH